MALLLSSVARAFNTVSTLVMNGAFEVNPLRIWNVRTRKKIEVIWLNGLALEMKKKDNMLRS